MPATGRLAIIKNNNQGGIIMKKNLLACTMKDEQGQGMVEYGLIIALVAVVAIAGLIILGPKIAQLFEGIGDKLNTPAAG
jgi:pilus assembly protein Flp/PilA